jgi:hypothetical protein
MASNWANTIWVNRRPPLRDAPQRSPATAAAIAEKSPKVIQASRKIAVRTEESTNIATCNECPVREPDGTRESRNTFATRENALPQTFLALDLCGRACLFSRPNSASLAGVDAKICVSRRESFP